MASIKISLSSIDLMEIADLLAEIELPVTIQGIPLTAVTFPALIHKELREIIVDRIWTEDLTKVRKLIIPESYCLLFFMTFNGPNNMKDYRKVAVKNLCTQLEEALFKSGRFRTPSHYSTQLLNF